MANDNNDSKVLTVDHLPIIKAYIDKNMQTTFDNVINEKLEENKQSNEDYLKGQLAEAKLSLEEQYKKDKLDLIKELEYQINAGNTAAVTELKLRLDALNADNAQMNDALDELGKSIDDTNSIFSQGQLNDLIKTAMINETIIDGDHIETSNMYAKNLVALIAKFGSVKAEKITGSTIEGKTIRQYGDNSKWALNEDGSGQLASGKIQWDKDGNLTFDTNTVLEWKDITDADYYLNEALKGVDDKVKEYLQTFLDEARKLNEEELKALQEELAQSKEDTTANIDNIYYELNNKVKAAEENTTNTVTSLSNTIKKAINGAGFTLDLEQSVIETDFESCFLALGNAIKAAYEAGDIDMQNSLNEVRDNLQKELTSYQSKVTEQGEALDTLTSNVEHIHSQALTSEGLASLINTVLIDSTKIDANSVSSPNMLTRNLTALFANFGTVNASNIIGTNIQGYTVSSPLYEKTADNEYVYEKDANGNVIQEIMVDADGNIQYETDEKGNIIKDENGDPKPKYKYKLVLDINGNPVHVPVFKRYMKPLKDAAWVLAEDGSGHLANGKISWDENGDITLGDGVTLKWGQVEEKPDIIGEFTSTVFTRTNFDISSIKPTGGDDKNPKPKDSEFIETLESGETKLHTIKWTDGIPDGEEMLWASTRKFGGTAYDSETNKVISASETSEWSLPQKMTDTATFDVEFSKVVDDPGNPTDNKDNWSNDSDKDTIWMATRTAKNGVFGEWNISKIKGEDGKSAEQLFVSNTFDQVYVDENGIIINGDQNISTEFVYMIGDAKQDNDAENKTFALAYHVEFSYVLNNVAYRFVSSYIPIESGHIWESTIKDLFKLCKGQNNITDAQLENGDVKLTSDILVVFDVDNDTTDYLNKYTLSKTLVLKRIQSNTDYDLWVNDLILNKKFNTVSGTYNYTPESTLIDVYSKKVGINDGTPISRLDTMPEGMTIVARYINGDTQNNEEYTNQDLKESLKIPTTLVSTGKDANGGDVAVVSTLSKIELYNKVLDSNILFDEVVLTIVTDGVDGADGISSFISSVYTVSATEPKTPTGGNYNMPKPTDEVDGKRVWSDGIPDNVNGPLWCSQRVFYSDDSGDTSWSRPVLLSDTDTFQVEYGTASAKLDLTNFGEYYATTNGNIDEAERLWRANAKHSGWSDNTSDAKYMATCSKISGTNNWSNWVVTQIKGEKGEKGENGKDGVNGENAPTIFIAYAYKRSNENLSATTPHGGTIENPLPTNVANGDCPWSDGVISDVYHPGKLWQTHRTFNSDKDDYNNPSSIKWSTPTIVTDNEYTQVVYGTINADKTKLPDLRSDAYKEKTSTEVGALFNSIDNWDNEPIGSIEYHYMAVAKCTNGKWGDWMVTKIKGENGDPIFVAYAFIRTKDDNMPSVGGGKGMAITQTNNGDIITPTTDWKDSIPDDIGKVWMTQATIRRTYDYENKQYKYVFDNSSGWSTPVVMIDTEYQEIIYGTKETNGSISFTPEEYVNNKAVKSFSNWDDEPMSGKTYWYMAVAKCKNGDWGSWMVTKIKGEDGQNGADGKDGADGAPGQDGRSINIAGSFDTLAKLNDKYKEGPKTPSGNIDFSCGFIVTYKSDGVTPLGELFMWLLGADMKYAWTSVGKVQGPQGPDGKTAYIHIKYAKEVIINSVTGRIERYVFTDPAGDLKEGEPVGPYQGIYTDYEEKDSDEWEKYKWSFIDSVKAVETQLKKYSIHSTLIEGHTVQCGVTTVNGNNTPSTLVPGTKYDTGFDESTGKFTTMGAEADGSQAGPVWQLSQNGYGYIAGGNIHWDANGNVHFGKGVKLSWKDNIDDETKPDIPTGGVSASDVEDIIATEISGMGITANTIEGKTIQSTTKINGEPAWQINNRGDGYLAGNNINWDTKGNLFVTGGINGEIGSTGKDDNGNTTSTGDVVVEGNLVIKDNNNNIVSTLQGNRLYPEDDNANRKIVYASGISNNTTYYKWMCESNNNIVPYYIYVATDYTSYIDTSDGTATKNDRRLYITDVYKSVNVSGSTTYYKLPYNYTAYFVPGETEKSTNADGTFEYTIDIDPYIIVNVDGVEYKYNKAGTYESKIAEYSNDSKVFDHNISHADTIITSDGTIETNKLIANDGYFNGTINAEGDFSGRLHSASGTINNATISHSNIGIYRGDKVFVNSNYHKDNISVSYELLSISPDIVLRNDINGGSDDNEVYMPAKSGLKHVVNNTKTDYKTYSDTIDIGEITVVDGMTIDIPAIEISAHIYHNRRDKSSGKWEYDKFPKPKVNRIYLRCVNNSKLSYDGTDYSIIELLESSTQLPINYSSVDGCTAGVQYDCSNNFGVEIDSNKPEHLWTGIKAKGDGIVKIYADVECTLRKKQAADKSTCSYGFRLNEFYYDNEDKKLKVITNAPIVLKYADNSQKFNNNSTIFAKNGVLIKTSAGHEFYTGEGGDIRMMSADKKYGFMLNSNGVFIKGVDATGANGKWIDLSKYLYNMLKGNSTYAIDNDNFTNSENNYMESDDTPYNNIYIYNGSGEDMDGPIFTPGGGIVGGVIAGDNLRG